MRAKWAIITVAALLALFAVLARRNALRMSITYDETLHIGSAYAIAHEGDFRVNSEDPPLFQRWAALGLPTGALDPRKDIPGWGEMLGNPYAHWDWSNDALFGRDRVMAGHTEMLAHVRAWMLVIALALGAATAALAWTLGQTRGPTAAAAAAVLVTVLFALDPTFLGHSSLVKNDIFLTLSYTLTLLSLIHVGRRVTFVTVGLLALSVALGVATKFSGLLLGPAVVLALLARALMPTDWPMFGRVARTRWTRLAVVPAVALICAVLAYDAIWTVYGFRYSASPVPGERMSFEFEQTMGKVNSAWRRHATPTTQQIESEPVPAPIRAMTWVAQHHLVPEAYGKGFNYTYASTIVRWSFLLDELSTRGWWYYFPLALLFKLPVGTWGLLLLGAGLGVAGLFARRKRSEPPDWQKVWTLAAVGIPLAYYFLSAVTGSFNIGIRHMLPVLPGMYALAACALAGLWVRVRKPARAFVLLLLAGLALETLSSKSSYIAFFNAPAQAYGPEHLLSDSNIDWSQDLPRLVEWQRDNPYTSLGLIFFGPVTPEAYGLRYQALEGTEFSRAKPIPFAMANPGVIAISLTHLQEVNIPARSRGVFELFRRMKPREVLGNSIFIYTWPPRPGDIGQNDWALYIRRGDKSERLVPANGNPPAIK